MRKPSESSPCFAILCTGLIALSSGGCSASSDSEVTPPAPVFVQSEHDLALSFDGYDDYATAGTAGFPAPGEGSTVSLWIRPAEIEGRQSLVTIRRDTQGGLELGLEDGVLTAWSAWSGRSFVQDTTQLVAGVWQHVAYRYESGEHCLFVQAALAACSSERDPDSRTPTSAWLGTFDGTRDLYSGLVDDFRVWAVARAEAGLVSEMLGEVLDGDSDLLTYVNFNESWGTRAFDRSGNGNHLSLGDGIQPWIPERVVVDGSKP